jgi:predicted nucleic acid-binding protein
MPAPILALDTTVLVYSTGADHALREPCRRLIEAIERDDVRATSTAEVIQEFVHVRARRGGRPEAVALGRAFLDLLSPLLVLSDSAVRRALDLFERHPGLGAFDALLVAAATEADVDAVISADKGFASLTKPRHLDPASAELNELLS